MGNLWKRFFNTGAFTMPHLSAGTPALPDDSGIPYITNFLYTQRFSENFIFLVGKKRMGASHDNNIFAGGDGVEQFQNLALITNPVLRGANPFSSFFVSTVFPQEWGMVSAYLIDASDRQKEFFTNLDALFEDGMTFSAQVRVFTNFFDRPGQHHVGGVWSSKHLLDLGSRISPPTYPYPIATSSSGGGQGTSDSSFSIFYGFDQYLKVYSDKPRQGWGLFGRASISDGNPSHISYFLSTGIGGYSPLGNYRGDQFGVGWFFTKSSSEWGAVSQAQLGPQDETGIELFYNFQARPWLNITPDFQFIRPGLGAFASRNSFIFGLRINMKL